MIGDLERISDHSVNIVEAVEELREKKIAFSETAMNEVHILQAALTDILTKTKEACANNDIELAAKVEPLEQAIDDLIDRIKLHHVVRLQQGECTIELGFVLNDLLTCYERVSDHCSNVAGCIIEISKFGALDMHKYLAGIKHDSENFYQKYNEYTHKYHIED